MRAEEGLSSLRFTHHYDSHFTSLRGLSDSFKINVIPYPSTLNCNNEHVGVRTFLRNLKILKKNNKANIPINKLFGEDKLFGKNNQFQSQNLFETEEVFCRSASAVDWILKERYKREFLLIFAYTVSY